MTLYTEPTYLTQGERVAWTRDICGNYPSTLWTVKYKFRGPSTGFDVTATVDGLNFAAVITAAQSLTMAVGTWKWWAEATEIANALNIIEVGNRLMTVYQGAPTSTVPLETRSVNEIILAELQSAYRSGLTVAEWESSTPAGSRKIKYTSRKDLLEQIRYYSGLVANEKRAAGGGFLRTHQYRMPG